MSEIINITNLNFHYGNFKVLDDLNLSVKENSIFGFLGPNGAGKTTTIKILLGLLSTPKNKVSLFHKNLKTDRIEILSKVGSLVENPSIYNHLTAIENLKILTTMLHLKSSMIDEVLKIVGLDYIANKKAGKFSTGMKQRLGIAKALISDPQLIILDEPTIGLDPKGIIEIRELLLTLNKEYGKTIFLSSHNLSEVDKICDEIGIIDNGHILFRGTKDDLNSYNKTSLIIKADNIKEVCYVLSNTKIECKITEDNSVKTPFISDIITSFLIRTLVENDIQIYSVEKEEITLEELFINIISS